MQRVRISSHGSWVALAHAGANHDDARGYMPHITSYDYGAPIGESGLLTDKFRVRG